MKKLLLYIWVFYKLYCTKKQFPSQTAVPSHEYTHLCVSLLYVASEVMLLCYLAQLTGCEDGEIVTLPRPLYVVSEESFFETYKAQFKRYKKDKN